MEIVVVGLNHKVAPVEVRERHAFGPGQQEAALEMLLRRADEAVILSTCNRTEIYAVFADAIDTTQAAVDFLGEFHGTPTDALVPYLYNLRAQDAVDHIFAVAAGLDSMILGEPQILGQVRAAYQAAADRHAVGPVLSWVFHHALKVGKQVRTDTEITRNAVSVSYAAVELARRIFGSLGGRTVLVLGAGTMGELAARTLVDNGLSHVVVTNRTFARAIELATRIGGRAADFACLPELVAEADVVISSTSAPGFVLTAELVERAILARHHRPLFLIDIAVPRDVDPRVQDLDGVFLYDIDDLQAVCTANLEERQKEVDHARKIVDSEIVAFQVWWATLAVAPTISALRERAEEIRQAELGKALRRMGDLSEGQRSTLEAATAAIVKKLLHQPITRLKTPSDGSADALDRVRAFRELFDLDGGVGASRLEPGVTREDRHVPSPEAMQRL